MEKAQVLLKTVLRIFKIALRLGDRHAFMCGNFESFQYFNFEIDFLENENFFQKIGVLHFSSKRIISLQNCHIRSLLQFNNLLSGPQK